MYSGSAPRRWTRSTLRPDGDEIGISEEKKRGYDGGQGLTTFGAAVAPRVAEN